MYRLEDYSVTEITALILSKGLRFEAFALKFQEEGIDGKCVVISMMNESTFRAFVEAIGIKDKELAILSIYHTFKSIKRREGLYSKQVAGND